MPTPAQNPTASPTACAPAVSRHIQSVNTTQVETPKTAQPQTPVSITAHLRDTPVQLGFVGAHANPKMAESPYLALLLEELASVQ